MTLKTFASKTGWPIEEILALKYTEFQEILELMGLSLYLVILRM